MAQHSLCVLLDANIIIEAHARNVWASVVERVTLVVPSTVIAEATHYISPQSGMRMEIHLGNDLQDGRIREVSATVDQLAQLLSHFDIVFVQRMDPGETEALALLLAGELENCLFCSSDGPAIRALNLLGIPDRGISFERLLRAVGLERQLLRPFDESFFREMQAQGSQEFVQGIGLSKPTAQTKSTQRKPRRSGKSRKNR